MSFLVLLIELFGSFTDHLLTRGCTTGLLIHGSRDGNAWCWGPLMGWNHSPLLWIWHVATFWRTAFKDAGASHVTEPFPQSMCLKEKDWGSVFVFPGVHEVWGLFFCLKRAVVMEMWKTTAANMLCLSPPSGYWPCHLVVCRTKLWMGSELFYSCFLRKLDPVFQPFSVASRNSYSCLKPFKEVARRLLLNNL